MIVKKIALNGFRNYDFETAEFAPGTNVICGENAQGKTNLMEAIWLFSGMKSFRGAKDAELVSHGQEFAKLRLQFSDSRRENTAELTITAKRAAVLNGVKLPSAPSLIGKFSAVVFAPSFYLLLKTGPRSAAGFSIPPCAS